MSPLINLENNKAWAYGNRPTGILALQERVLYLFLLSSLPDSNYFLPCIIVHDDPDSSLSLNPYYLSVSC
jgi:hypothetical protein